MTWILRMLALLASLAALPRLLAVNDGGGSSGGSGSGDGAGGAAGGSGDDDDDDDGDDDGDDDDADGGEGGDGSGDGDGDGERRFTQADIDKAVRDRLTRERKKHEKKLQREVEKAKTEAQQAVDDAGNAAQQGASDEKLDRLRTRAVKAEAKSVAIAAGVKPERMGRFLRLVDLDDVDVDDDGEVDEDEVADRVKTALDDVPEFAGTSGGESGDGKTGGSGAGKSGGDSHKGDDGQRLLTADELRNLSVEEQEENWDLVQRSLAALGRK